MFAFAVPILQTNFVHSIAFIPTNLTWNLYTITLNILVPKLTQAIKRALKHMFLSSICSHKLFNNKDILNQFK